MEEDEIPKKKSSKKSLPPAPKVVPKKSATAKPISKGNSSAPAKSKQYIDTETDSDIDDSISFTKQNLKEQKSKKEKEKKSTKSSKEKVKSSVLKSSSKSAVKAASVISGSESADTDTSLIRYLRDAVSFNIFFPGTFHLPNPKNLPHHQLSFHKSQNRSPAKLQRLRLQRKKQPRSRERTIL